MGRGKDFRQKGGGRRGFDDDFPPQDSYQPRSPYGGGGGAGGGGGGFSGGGSSFNRGPLPDPTGDPVQATVKWFNGEKGYGFAEISDGSGDAFLHIAALQALGREAVPPGATLQVYVGQGQKGRQITKVVSVDDSTATAEAPRAPRPGGGGERFGGGGGGGFGGGAGGPRRGPPDLGPATEMAGTVKWFSVDKGMGFVETGDGGKDVFVHISAVERAGMATLNKDQRVSYELETGRDGKVSAVNLEAA